MPATFATTSADSNERYSGRIARDCQAVFVRNGHATAPPGNRVRQAVTNGVSIRHCDNASCRRNRP
jgi:hypothetical protein